MNGHRPGGRSHPGDVGGYASARRVHSAAKGELEANPYGRARTNRSLRSLSIEGAQRDRHLARWAGVIEKEGGGGPLEEGRPFPPAREGKLCPELQGKGSGEKLSIVYANSPTQSTAASKTAQSVR